MRIFLLIILPFVLFSEILKYENLKPFYYKNQLVNLNIRIILSKPSNLTIQTSYNVETNLTKINPYIYKLNLKFLANHNPHKVIIIGKKLYKEINLNKIINIKELNYPKNYSNIVADNLEVINPIATNYKKNKIILNFNIKCKNCLINKFNIKNYEQNLTPISTKEASYYIILPKNTKTFNFYYFNLKNQMFKKITIPIILSQQTISTQTNINPEEEKFFTPVNIFILILIAFSLIIFLIYQKVILILIPILLSLFFVLKIIPKGEITIKKGTKLQILPTKQSTIIYITNKNTKAKVLNKVNSYIKVKIDNKIGWVKNEDTK